MFEKVVASQTLERIYNHPVKGLRPESKSRAQLILGNGIEGDRAFAFQFLDDSIPEELRKVAADHAPWMSKSFLAVQHDWPDLARLVPVWNGQTQKLRITSDDQLQSIEESVTVPEGRKKLADFVLDFLQKCQPYAKARHPTITSLRLVGSADNTSRYTDGEKGPISIALMESLADLELKYGFGVDAQRFRVNLFLKGAPSWSELNWAGRILRIGNCKIKFTKPIGRCPNIDVDPISGERKDEIFPTMKQKCGHSLFGMRSEVVVPGEILVGDNWELG